MRSTTLADCDCTYNEDWLGGLLEAFADSDVAVVAGETAMQGSGAYALAMAITHAFDGFSKEKAPYPSDGYYANNVAFRRTLLLELPIPDYLPAYRNACYIHSIELRRHGLRIVRQPRSRAGHANPEDVRQFLLRFFLSGSDKAVRRRCAIFDDAPKLPSSPPGAVSRARMRLRRSLANGAAPWASVPGGVFIAVGAWVVEGLGLFAGYLFPDGMIRVMSRVDGVDRPTVAQTRSRLARMSREPAPWAE